MGAGRRTGHEPAGVEAGVGRGLRHRSGNCLRRDQGKGEAGSRGRGPLQQECAGAVYCVVDSIWVAYCGELVHFRSCTYASFAMPGSAHVRVFAG